MSSRWLQMRFPQDDGWNAANPSCQQVPDAGASRPLKFHPCQKQRYPARSSCCSVACSEKAPPCRLQCTEYSNSSRSTLARATGGGGLGGMHGAAAADARRQQAGGRLGGRGHARLRGPGSSCGRVPLGRKRGPHPREDAAIPPLGVDRDHVRVRDALGLEEQVRRGGGDARAARGQAHCVPLVPRPRVEASIQRRVHAV